MTTPVRRITLRSAAGQAPREVPRWVGPASWLVAPLLLAAMLGTFVLIRKAPEGVFTLFIAAVCAVPVIWGLVSILFPASPDRRCPECGELGLEAMSELELHGVRCTDCGYEDESVGTWIFAEERDAPLEPLVIASRKSPSSPATDPR